MVPVLPVKPKWTRSEPPKVLLRKVAGQRAAELAINPIRQRLRGGVPGDLRRMPGSILQIADGGLR